MCRKCILFPFEYLTCFIFYFLLVDDVRSLALPGTYHEKVTHLGNSLLSFSRLKHLDLSRNALQSIDGLQHLGMLEKLNLYPKACEVPIKTQKTKQKTKK